MSEFHEALDTLKGEHSQEQISRGAQMAIESLLPHLEQISGDFAGSAIDDFFSPENAEICNDFLDYVEACRTPGGTLPGSRPLDMTVRKSGRHAWKKPNGYPTSTLLRPYVLKKVWQGEGYLIGELKLDMGKTPVLLCGDRRLRCLRTPTIFNTSYAWGYGTLPPALEGRNAMEAPNLAQNLAKQVASET